MLKALYVFLTTLLGISSGWAQSLPSSLVTLRGFVRIEGSDKPLAGVNVYVIRKQPAAHSGTITTSDGFYAISLSARDSIQVAYSAVGYQTATYTLYLQSDSVHIVSLSEGLLLGEVSVSTQRLASRLSENLAMSHLNIPIEQVKNLPALLGEKDGLKAIQLLPGVQKGSEGQTGFYVRGGGADQNLITLDEATVYNPSHLFGFFSAFNGDALQGVNLQKGGFPARYGGRLSSVIELTMKVGNRDKFHGEGGVGLLASRFTLDGPFPKSKTAGKAAGSYVVSGRRTYFNELVSPLLNRIISNPYHSRYSFYDLNAKIHYAFGPKNALYLSGYLGQDRFHNQDPSRSVGLDWGNRTGTLRWNHRWGHKLASNLSLLYSQYQSTSSALQPNPWGADNLFSLQYGSGIRNVSLKYDMLVYANAMHSLQLGGQTTGHYFKPTARVLDSGNLNVPPTSPNGLHALESGIYVEDSWQPTDHWRLNGGLRISYFQQQVRYLRPEPRLSVRYILKADWLIKGSYALTNQFVHLLSTTGLSLPTDVWVPTTPRVTPQRAQQLAVGLVKDFAGRELTLTVEGYRKLMDNITTLKEGASFMPLANPTDSILGWEDNLLSGKGWSYGLEMLLQKKSGPLTGWAGYTLSWTHWQFADLNGGRPFFPLYDRRHDISLVGIYQLTKQIMLSGTWVYGTGNWLTLPLSRYKAYQPVASTPYNGQGSLVPGNLQGAQWINDYGPERNNFQAQAYHRFDLGVQFIKKRHQYQRTWEVSVYNAYNRRNPFFYQLESVPQGPNQPKRMGLFSYSVFPLLPSLSYNFSF